MALAASVCESKLSMCLHPSIHPIILLTVYPVPGHWQSCHMDLRTKKGQGVQKGAQTCREADLWDLRKTYKRTSLCV